MQRSSVDGIEQGDRRLVAAARQLRPAFVRIASQRGHAPHRAGGVDVPSDHFCEESVDEGGLGTERGVGLVVRRDPHGLLERREAQEPRVTRREGREDGGDAARCRGSLSRV